MAKAGDRVVFEGVKVGGARREGKLLEVVGRGVRVRWEDGSDSLLFPGPGAMRVVTSGRRTATAKATASTVKAKATAKKKAAPAKKAASAKKKR